MEHIQMNYYKEIFDNVHRVLKPDGIGLFHSIGSHERPNRHDHFIQKYIFPDSRTLLLSDLAIELETRKMPVQDVENIGRHYHYTLMAWRRNSQRYFDAHPGKVPEEFQRLWVYYLESLAAYSLWGDGVLFHTVFYNSSRCPRPFNRVV
jgi:cyclopropane-fatty-acyl-phospholipid synthase